MTSAAATAPRPCWRGLLGVARAPFLPLAVLLACSGSLAQGSGRIDGLVMLLAVVGLVAAHVLVNVCNELADDRSGLDYRTRRTPFSGGSGALQAGLVTRRAAAALAWGSAATMTAVGLWAVVGRGATALAPVLVGGALCIGLYSPWLLRWGLGELAAGLGLGGLPVLGAAILQGTPLLPGVWWLALAATALTFNLLLWNTIPDLEPDRLAGRRSLVHRLGVRGVARLGFAAGLAATLALVAGLVRGELPVAGWLALLPALPFLGLAARWLGNGTPLPVPMGLLAANVGHNLGTHAALVLAWWWASGS